MNFYLFAKIEKKKKNKNVSNIMKSTGKFLRKLFLKSGSPEVVPSQNERRMPPAIPQRQGPPPNPTGGREGPMVGSAPAADEHAIPPAPVEAVSGSSSRPQGDWQPNVEIRESPPFGHPISDGLPTYEDSTPFEEFMRRWVRPRVPQSHPLPPEKGGASSNGDYWEFDSRRGDGGSNGGQPPRPYGGDNRPSDNSGGPNSVFFYFILATFFYYLYQMTFNQYQKEFQKLLDAFEKRQQEATAPTYASDSKAAVVPRVPRRAQAAVWRDYVLNRIREGGLLAGGDLARRALEATVLPAARRVAEAVVPAVVRTLTAPILNVLGRLTLMVWSPATKFGLFLWCFYKAFDGCWPKLLSALFSVQPLAPLLPKALDLLQNLFVAPMGYSYEVVFMANLLKVFSVSWFLGEAAVQFQIYLREDDGTRSFSLVIMFGTFALFILFDRKYVYLFVAQIVIKKLPELVGWVSRPVVRVLSIFASSVFLQSLQFPKIVNAIFVVLLLYSGLFR